MPVDDPCSDWFSPYPNQGPRLVLKAKVCDFLSMGKVYIKGHKITLFFYISND